MTVYEKFLARSINKKHSITIQRSEDSITFQGKIRKFIRFDTVYSDSYFLNRKALYLNPEVGGYRMPNVEVDFICEKNTHTLIQNIKWINLNVYNYHKTVLEEHNDSYQLVYRENNKKLVKSFYKNYQSKKLLIGRIICR